MLRVNINRGGSCCASGTSGTEPNRIGPNWTDPKTAGPLRWIVCTHSGRISQGLHAFRLIVHGIYIGGKTHVILLTSHTITDKGEAEMGHRMLGLLLLSVITGRHGVLAQLDGKEFPESSFMKLLCVTKLFILSPWFLVCSLSTAHTCTVSAYTHHFDFDTGREYIMSYSGSHEARRKKIHPTQRSGRRGRRLSRSRSLEGYSQDAGNEIWEPRRRGLVRPVESLKGEVT